MILDRKVQPVRLEQLVRRDLKDRREPRVLKDATVKMDRTLFQCPRQNPQEHSVQLVGKR